VEQSALIWPAARPLTLWASILHPKGSLDQILFTRTDKTDWNIEILALLNCYTAQVGLLQIINPPTPRNNLDKQKP